jgi:hypothetical protein
MKSKSPGAARPVGRKSLKSFQKVMERQRELHKLNAALEKNGLKRRRAELEAKV